MKKMFILFSLLVISEVFAHEGPPYPILVDQKFLTYKLSVWADPDTENGTFLFYPEGENLKSDNYIYEVKATPQMGSKEILKGTSLQSVDEKGKFTYTATIPFSSEGMWNVEIKVKNKQNGDILLNQTIAVSVTPPGPNPMETLIYMIPFVLLGLIWIKVVIHKRKKKPTPP